MKNDLFKWVKGRHFSTRYKKFTLWYFKFWKLGFDGYILNYEPNTVLDSHYDKVENAKHYRLNIEFSGSSVVETEMPIRKRSLLGMRYYMFRPDINEHKVIIGESGAKKISLGFVKFK